MKHRSPWSLSISQRLLLVAFIVVLGLAGIAAFAFVQLEKVKDTARQTEQVRVHQLAQAAAMELNITRISLQLRHAILARNPAELEEALADIGKKRALIEKAAASYESLIFTEKGRQLFSKLPVALEKFWRMGSKNIQMIREGQKEAAFAFLVEHTIPARNEVLAVLSEKVQYQHSQLAQDIDGIGQSVDATLKAILLLALGCTLALFVAALHLGRVLRRRVQFTGDVVERIREGNLSQSIHDSTHDEFSPLVAALENMQSRLNQVATKVRQGADFVELASNAIANDNEDLSQRTQGQATALNVTTEAAMQLAGKIEHNFNNAKNAVELSNEAVDVAKRGGKVVANVVSTMEEINTSSKRIEEIIGVIEGIAFQTNILALNAAVEAARAGEQGRGFAVVATEVRSLAQRSSHAAHEIKELISTSVERVAVGSNLVSEAGATMQEIVQAIQKVKDIVNAINLASEEQNRSLVEVNHSMQGMEQTTGQNAALVQKMNQSASELRHMANELVSIVSYFQTYGSAHQAGTQRLPVMGQSAKRLVLA